MRTRTALLLAGLALAVAPALAAQEPPLARESRGPAGLRTYVGGNLAIGEPQGEFGDYIDTGIGGQFTLIQGIEPTGLLGIRLDAGGLIYGSERYRVPLSGTIGGRVLVDVNTTNSIAFVGVGPQLGLPDGTLKPYVHGFLGWSYLVTRSGVSGSAEYEDFASTVNFDDGTFAWGGGAGLYVPLGGGRNPVSLDLGATYFDGGEADYLREGGIRDNPDGTITVFPVRSETDLLSFRIGVMVGVGR